MPDKTQTPKESTQDLNTNPPNQTERLSVTRPGKGPGKLLLYYALFITFALITTLFFIFFKNSAKPTQLSTSNDQEEKPSPSQTAEKPASFVFLRDFSLYLKTDNGSLPVKDAENVYAFDYSKSKNLVVFVSGNFASTPESYKGPKYIDPQYVYLSDLKGVPKKIFELKPEKSESSDYSYQLRDVSFSPDGTKIAITTSQDIYVYDISSDKLNKVFSLPPDKTSRGFVYVYRDPVFSPDNSKILITKGYYEGASQAYIDAATGNMTDLPFDFYVSGKRAVEWKDENTLLAYEYADTTDETNPGSRVFYYSVQDKKENEISKIEGSVFSLINQNGKFFMATGSFVKNNSGYSDRYDNIYELDTVDKTPKKLYSQKQITPENDMTPITAISKAGNPDTVYVEISKLKKGESVAVSTVYLLDTNDPGNLKEIEGNAVLP